MLTNPYLIAFGVPIFMMLCSAITKKIIRNGGWKASDFFLGLELVLATLGSAAVYLVDMRTDVGQVDNRASLSEKVGSTGTFMAISLFLLIVILAVHQEWEARTGAPKRQFFWLGIVCNGVGICTFATFVIVLKGV